ncbi:MAG: hypothetical protein INQ03_01520 [Candidatus Heimdallarchaeota archaeon]|nr:hypothetical protein [Candidatus Heimdallarchaeota archaeon]
MAKKPKCFECNGAMKRIYQRTGSRGITQAINHWWYCGNCDHMQIDPILISKKKDEYLHPDAADKFPKIARVMQEYSKKQYKVRDALSIYTNLIKQEQEIQDMEKRRNILKYRSLLKKRYVIKRKEAIAFWHCAACNVHIRLTPDESLSDEKPEQPLHCEKMMKLGILSAADYHKLEREQMINDIISLCNDGKFEEAGMTFVDLTLAYLLGYNSYGIQKQLLEMKPLFNLKDTEFVNTWGYHTVVGIFNTFQEDDIAMRENPLLDRASFIYITPIIRPQEKTARLLDKIFDDLILYLSVKAPHLIPRYRLKTSKIISFMEDWSRILELRKTGGLSANPTLAQLSYIDKMPKKLFHPSLYML